MFTSRSLLRIRGERPPGRSERRRRWSLLRTAVALGLCTIVSGALFSPGSVFGATRPESSEAVVAEQAPAPQAEVSPAAEAVKGASADTIEMSQGTLLVKLPWGSANGEVGLEAPAEGLTRGPEAVAIAPDGRIAVLDSVNRRLVVLDSAGGFQATIPVELAQPRFLAVNDGRLYVLDCDGDRRLMSVDWDGSGPSLSELPVFDDVVTGLFATDAGVCVEIAHNQAFVVAEPASASAAATSSRQVGKPGKAALRPLPGRPIGQRLGEAALVSFRPGKGVQIKSFKVDRESLKASPPTQSLPQIFQGLTVEHLVSADSDGRGGLVLGARLLDEQSSSSRGPALVVTRISALGTPALDATSASVSAADDTGTQTGTVFLPECSFAYLGQPYVVTQDGRVVRPFADETGYGLMVYSFDQNAEVTP